MRNRYAGLLDLENLMAVSDARAAESAVHALLGDYRLGGDGRELFDGSLTPYAVQLAFEWGAQRGSGLRGARRRVVRFRDRVSYEDD